MAARGSAHAPGGTGDPGARPAHRGSAAATAHPERKSQENLDAATAVYTGDARGVSHRPHPGEPKSRLLALANEIASRELELLEARFEEARALREAELEKKAEKARQVSGLDRYLERKAQRERLAEEIARREEELLNLKLDHAEELKQDNLRKKATAAANQTAKEPLHAVMEHRAFDRAAELHRLREEHAEKIHKSSLEERLRRVEGVDYTDRVLHNKEIIDSIRAEKVRQTTEKLEARTSQALEKRHASMEEIAMKAHQLSGLEKHAEAKAKAEDREAKRVAAHLRDEEAGVRAADERRRASLEDVAARAHVSADLERHVEARERLDAEFEERVLKRLREEEERSAAAYERRRRSLEEIAAKAHQAADLPRYSEIRAQLAALAEERRTKREEELEARSAAALERRRASLENATKFARTDLERVAQSVYRYEEMKEHELEMLIAERKLMGLRAGDNEPKVKDKSIALLSPEEGIPVPQNTPVNTGSGIQI